VSVSPSDVHVCACALPVREHARIACTACTTGQTWSEAAHSAGAWADKCLFVSACDVHVRVHVHCQSLSMHAWHAEMVLGSALLKSLHELHCVVEVSAFARL
jgi:hypothetical protein